MMKYHQAWKRIMSASLCGVLLSTMATAGLSYGAAQNEALDQLVQDTGLVETAEAATLNYATELAKFPKSYQTQLALLHKKYPDWVFVAQNLDRDWQTVLNGENQPKVSTVTSASEILRSRQSGDYNPSNGSYTSRDGSSTHSANELAVAYFLDPRNFLDEKNIFQFEALSYNASYHNLKGVQAILDGTWMDKANITYYDTSGNSKTIQKTYAEVILQAGKDAAASPYFLAAKILNEVGKSSPSSSANGKHSEYPGIYNFYCIQATNGSDAITKGLRYAAGSGSYERPWNTPVRAISGGAEWIAEGYINNDAGAQDTLYYQRFDVVKGDTNPYTHQYATNINYAATQGYDTYTGYEEIGLLNRENVFYIPVYDDMPGEQAQSAGIKLSTTSASQSGTITGSDVSLRSSATTSSNLVTRLARNTKVTILDKVISTTDYAYNFMDNPVWYKVSANGKTGYVSAEYVDINSNTINLKPGATYQLGATLSNKNTGEANVMSTRDAVATVAADGKITAKASGTCEIYAYTTGGGFDVVTVNVSSSATNSVSKASPIAKADQAGSGTSSDPEGGGSVGNIPSSGGDCTISASDVNVRASASTSGKILGTYAKGTKVTVSAVSGTWCKTADGWVSSEYVTAPKTGTVSGASTLNVRDAAGTSGKQVGTVKEGTSLKLYNSKAVSGTTWYLTSAGGWVSGEYVKVAGSGSSGTTTGVTSMTAKVSGDYVNIRKGPSTSYAIAGRYNKNDSIKITEVSGNWVKTNKGWVSGDYVSAGTGKVSGTSSLKVYATPSTSAKQITTLKSGTSVKLYGYKTVSGTKWYMINKGGWVSSKNISTGSSGGSSGSGSSGTTTGVTSMTAKVSGDYVNIRKGPSTSYAIAGRYNKNDSLKITEVSGNWVKTNKGWVSGDYVSAGTGKVSGTSSLKVYATPSTSAKQITTLKSGTSVKLYGYKTVSGTKWYMINKGGWVSSKNISTGSSGGSSGSGSSGTTTGVTSMTAKVSGDYVNIRKGPSTSYAVVGRYNKNDSLKITEVSGNWVKTNKGWVSGDYVSADTGKVSGTSSLKVYATPSTSAKQITTLKSGTSVKLYGYKTVSGTKWYMINKGGWVSSKNISTGSSGGSSSSGNTASTAVTVKITGDYVNVRKGPSTSNAIVGSYKQGNKITVTEVSGNWVKTSKGWVSGDYVSASTGKVSSGTAVLNVRKSASSSAAIVATLKNGTSLKLYASKSAGGTTWYLTNKGGWVSSQYVKR